jgi:predicted nucleic acid-binding protein
LPISNSSLLIHLVRLGKIGYVKKIFPSIVIPPAVRKETLERGKAEGYGDAVVLENLEKDGWLKTTEVAGPSSKDVVGELVDVIGRGEAEAIALAVERGDRLLMDDQKGRMVAELYGVKTTTTLGLLFELLAMGVLPREDFRRNVKNYSGQGWITPEVVQEFLERGEGFG